MKCLNVIIYYDNREEVARYIRTVTEIGKGRVELALVVNRDEKRELHAMAEELRAEGCPFTLYDYGANVGYLNALLKTLPAVDLTQYDYIILSNTDIEYCDRTFFDKLFAARYEPDVGCIAPSVFVPAGGSYSNPHYCSRIPKKKIERLMWLFGHPRLAAMYLRLAGLKAKTVKSKKQPSRFVYSPHGCFMIFTPRFLERIAGYEYGALLYSEESCIGELLQRQGLRCYYDASIEVCHLVSTVTGRVDYKKRFAAWRESLLYIRDTFY